MLKSGKGFGTTAETCIPAVCYFCSLSPGEMNITPGLVALQTPAYSISSSIVSKCH